MRQKKYNRVHQTYQLHQTRLASCYDRRLKSSKTNTLADGVESKTGHKEKEGDRWRKKKECTE